MPDVVLGHVSQRCDAGQPAAVGRVHAAEHGFEVDEQRLPAGVRNAPG
jgi:hypothetical protein